MFKAEVIAASRNTFGQRITTMLITFPRFILAELNTHRMLSKNSASSRAIPFKKMKEMVLNNPFIPLKFQKEHTGMQGTEYLDELGSTMAESSWLTSRKQAVGAAESLAELGVTKQICNRLLEPFAWHTVLVTGTEWENFFALRAHPAAEIHMQHLAELMLEAYNNAEVKQLQPGEWHMPYGDRAIPEELIPLAQELKLAEIDLRLKVATARCAQTSYTLLDTEEKPMDIPKLIALHDRLYSMKHLSPFEHCAQAQEVPEWSGNFFGFTQYRKKIAGENQSDSRVRKD